MASSALTAPPRRAAVTAAPTLWRNRPASRFHIRHHRDPLQKRLHIGGDIRRIDRRTEEDAVRRLHLVKNFPEAVPAVDAVLLPAAGPAGLAGLDGLAGKPDHFRFDALFAQLIQYMAEQDMPAPAGRWRTAPLPESAGTCGRRSRWSRSGRPARGPARPWPRRCRLPARTCRC